MDRIRIFFQQSWLYYKGSNSQFNIEELIFYRIAVPLITLVYYCVIAKSSFSTSYLTSWVIGNSLLLCNNTCVFTLGASFESERYFGRLKWLITSPYSRIATVFQKGFLFIFESLVTVTLSMIFGSLIFSVSFANVNIGLFIIIILAGVFSAMCFGMFLSMFALISDSMHLILNLVNMAMMILCGANFPIKDLPSFAQYISFCLPFTRSIEAGNMLFNEVVDIHKLVLTLCGELLVGIIYLLVSAALFKFIEKMAIRKASLEIF